MEMEDTLKQTLQDLQKQLGKKQTFESAATSLAWILSHKYASAPVALQEMMYAAVCRMATLLQTRYVAPGFWIIGLKVFEEAEKSVTKLSEKNHMKACISRAREHLGETGDREDASAHQQQNTDSRFLFEGQLTVGEEPPPPRWLAAQNLLTALAIGSQASSTTAESSENLAHELGQNQFEGAHSASHPSLLYAVFGIILSLIMVSMAVLSCAWLNGGHNKKLKKPEIPSRRIGRVSRGEIVVKTVKGYRDPFFMGGGTRGGAGSALLPPVPTGGGTATAHGR